MIEIKTTSRPVLRRMLRDCDRKLEQFDKMAGCRWLVTTSAYQAAMYRNWQLLDARRREIRRRLKERR